MASMKLLLLCGSLRSGSTNEAVLRTAQLVAPPGVVASFFESVALLPHFNPDDDHDPLPASVADLRAAIDDAEALLICTPEYAGDLPGSFKNLLDWTVGGAETDGKPVAWINASTWPGGAGETHAALRRVLTYTGCTIIDEACVDLPVLRADVHGGVVIDPELRARIASAVATLWDRFQVQAPA
jgi:chromate reductase